MKHVREDQVGAREHCLALVFQLGAFPPGAPVGFGLGGVLAISMFRSIRCIALVRLLKARGTCAAAGAISVVRSGCRLGGSTYME